MSLFVHARIGHYLMNEAHEDGEPGAASDAGQEEQDVPEEEPGEEESGEEEDAQDDDKADEGLVLSLGDEPEPEDDQDDAAAPKWAKELRQRHKDLTRENRELKRQIEQKQAAGKPKPPEVGKKPALADPDIDYDESKYEAAYSAWQDRKRKADDFERDQRQAEEAANQAWEGRLNAYNEQKSKLVAQVPDYEDSASAMMDMFTTEQQAMIIDVADNAAQMVYVLGRNPAEAKKLAEIKSPTKFIRELSRLEDTKLKVTKKAAAKPAPERSPSGSASKAGAVDSTLERLRADAEKSGDYSKLMEYKRKQRKQA